MVIIVRFSVNTYWPKHRLLL